MNANTIPLQEVLPWSSDIPRNILVCDSIETDGSFVLSTMAAQLFSSPSLSLLPSSSAAAAKIVNRQRILSARVLWLSGDASTERQVASNLKKFGCDAGAAYLRNNNENSNSNGNGLTIRSLAVEIADRILMNNNPDNNEGNDRFDGESYLKNVYKDVKAWVNNEDDDDNNNNNNNNNTVEEDESEVVELDPLWVILDDVTALASILGDTLVYCFVESLISLLSRQRRRCGLIIRCSGDVDQMLHKIEGNEGNDHSGWVGAGGLAHKQAINDTIHRTLIPWERALEESVDAIVDVLPLLSGFSREAHGRLIFSETPNGRGWKKIQSSSNKNSTMTASSQASRPAPKTAPRSTSSKTKGTNWNKLILCVGVGG